MFTIPHMRNLLHQLSRNRFRKWQWIVPHCGTDRSLANKTTKSNDYVCLLIALYQVKHGNVCVCLTIFVFRNCPISWKIRSFFIHKTYYLRQARAQHWFGKLSSNKLENNVTSFGGLGERAYMRKSIKSPKRFTSIHKKLFVHNFCQKPIKNRPKFAFNRDK